MPDTDSDVLTSPTRRAILELLREAPDGLGASEAAAPLGLHVTTVRFHLERMVAAGVVGTAQRRGSVGRPRKMSVYDCKIAFASWPVSRSISELNRYM